MASFILKLITEYRYLLKPLFWALLSIAGIGFNYAIAVVMYNQNQTQVHAELKEIREASFHGQLNGFGGTLAAFRDEALRVEQENVRLAEQNAQLLECIQRNDCKNFPFLLTKRPHQPIDIMKAYEPIRKLLGEAYEKGEK